MEGADPAHCPVSLDRCCGYQQAQQGIGRVLPYMELSNIFVSEIFDFCHEQKALSF